MEDWEETMKFVFGFAIAFLLALYIGLKIKRR